LGVFFTAQFVPINMDKNKMQICFVLMFKINSLCFCLHFTK